MSYVVLLILALVWAVFLVPQLVRARAERNPADSIKAFRRQLSVLERTGPRGARSIPASASPSRRRASAGMPRPEPGLVRRRRRQILVGLLAAMSGTLVLALVGGWPLLLVVHGALDVLCGLYLAQLLRLRNVALEREAKVRYLPSTALAEPEPALLRRSAN